MVAYKLTLFQGAIRQVGGDAAYRTTVDTTRQVFNRANVLTPVRHGTLRAGNKMKVRRETLRSVGVIFNLVSYADAVHNGTPAYTIRPRRKKALKFVIDGEVVIVKSVRMPARRGRPWLLRALKEVAPPLGWRIVAV